MRVFSTLQMASAFVVWALTLLSAASADDWAKAVVQIGGCSGVCVSKEGLVLTAKHCTLGDRERVAFEDGPTVWATKLISSRNGDGPVAFVCDGDGFPHRPVAKTKPEPGDRVISYGYPNRGGTRRFERGEGTVTGGGRFELDGIPYHANDTTIQATFGWSGGPLLNAGGEVIGLCSCGDDSTTAFTSWASTRHAYDQALPLARDLILPYQRAEVVVFVTDGCPPCERLKADIAAGHFAKWKTTIVDYDGSTDAWSNAALYQEFLQTADVKNAQLAFPLIWVRRSPSFRTGYDPAQRGGLIGFLERVIDSLAKLVVGEHAPVPFPIGQQPEPDGTPALEPAPVVSAGLASVELLKADLAKARADIDRLKSANPLEKLRGVVALKSDVAAIKEHAAAVKDEAQGDPMQFLWGLIGIGTGLLHRRFAA
jgi:hypothetical protein